MVVVYRRSVVLLRDVMRRRARSIFNCEMSVEEDIAADDHTDAEIDRDMLADGGVRFDSGESAETSLETSE